MAENNNKVFIDSLANSLAAVRQLSADGLVVDSVCLSNTEPVIALIRPPPRHLFKSAEVAVRPKAGGGQVAKRVAFLNKCKVFWWEDC